MYVQQRWIFACCNINLSHFKSQFVDTKSVGLYNFSKKEKILYELPGILAIHFSTGQNHLVTLDKREKEKHYITVFEVPTLKKVRK